MGEELHEARRLAAVGIAGLCYNKPIRLSGDQGRSYGLVLRWRENAKSMKRTHLTERMTR